MVGSKTLPRRFLAGHRYEGDMSPTGQRAYVPRGRRTPEFDYILDAILVARCILVATLPQLAALQGTEWGDLLRATLQADATTGWCLKREGLEEPQVVTSDDRMSKFLEQLGRSYKILDTKLTGFATRRQS